MCLHVANLNHERLDSVVIALGYATSEDYCMICLPTKSTRPEFGCFDSGGVHGESVSLFIESCHSFQSSNIRPMTELSLSVAPNHIKIINLWDPVSPLLISSKRFNRVSKHSHMKRDWVLSWKDVRPREVLCLNGLFAIFDNPALRFFITHDDSNTLPPGAEFLFARHLVVIKTRMRLRVTLDPVMDLDNHFDKFRAKKVIA